MELLKDNSARLYAYSGSSAGCMELHELHVEEYAGVHRVGNNGSKIIGRVWG